MWGIRCSSTCSVCARGSYVFIYIYIAIFVQLRSWSYRAWARTWIHWGRISGMVQILQREVHPFFPAVIVLSILGFKFPNSYNSNLVHQLSILNSPQMVSPSFTLDLAEMRDKWWYKQWSVNFNNLPESIPPSKSFLPRPKDFSKALYTFDIGQNDLAYGFQHTTIEQVRLSIPNILSQLFQAVHVSKTTCWVWFMNS